MIVQALLPLALAVTAARGSCPSNEASPVLQMDKVSTACMQPKRLDKEITFPSGKKNCLFGQGDFLHGLE